MPSPTPWKIERSSTGSGVVIGVSDANGRDIRASAIGSTTAAEGSLTTEIIVRAVNAHDDLVAALKLLVADVQDYEAWQRPVRALEVAQAALAKVEAE